VGGLCLSLIPGLPHIELAPNVVFLLFVPPILYSAAYFTSWRNFQANLRPIILLALVLVIITTFGIAYIFKLLVPGLPWSVGCILGAIISPTDAIAATAVTHQIKVPRRVVTILEGESLINDASGLILYKFAIAALVTGMFSFTHAVFYFVLTGFGGVLLGLGLGWLTIRLRRFLDDVLISISISLLTPFIAYIVAEKLALSGILAVVAAGIIVGWHAPKQLTAHMRIKGTAVWETIVFFMNGFVFILIGLQWPIIISALSGWSYFKLGVLTLAIVLTTIILRFMWVFFSAYGLRFLIPRIRKKDPYPPWQQVLIISWAGMRGIISLGAALALPFYLANGAPFPARDLIIFLVFTSIIGTLVFQGITLPFIIKWLKVEDDNTRVKEERKARKAIVKAMLKELEKLNSNNEFSDQIIEVMRQEYMLYSAVNSDADHKSKESIEDLHKVRQKLITAGRSKLVELRYHGEISDEILHVIQTELDIHELKIK
jgi:CPA1 family monovalent cation:H+ antiporter